MTALLEAKNLQKNYSDKIALNDFSISIPKGCIYGLLGPNGAGKTTFIRIINQITAPDSGSVYFDGELLSKKHISQIGYMPEERGLYKNMAIGEQALYLAQLKGMSKKEAQLKLDYWFEKLNIEKWWSKKLSELSKGMAQKIQFVVTVLHQPKLLIFDEPFSGFDPLNANLIRDEILELKQKGTTIIFSTHRMESVEELCDHIALINQSEKVLDGKIETIREQHKTNTFQVEFKNVNEEKLQLIQEKFGIQVKKTNSHNQFNLNLTTSILTQNELIQELLSVGELIHFSELIPNMNTIFIKNVLKNP